LSAYNKMYELTGAVGAQEDNFIKRMANGTRSAFPRLSVRDSFFFKLHIL
jgi:hypothetical protein